MAQLLTTSPRGTQDVLGDGSFRWNYIERRLREICERFGYREVRTPTFEHTELFERGVGDTTDVVGKEMYTMTDKGGRSITLRPEGTAGVARAAIEGGVFAGTLPVRDYYLFNCFRYEKPQAGRLREFHQLGIELYGCARPDGDVEAIRVAATVLRELGVKNVKLKINSIGCPECRAKYRRALQDFFRPHESELCETCRSRLERNPMRVLDCKSPVCQEIAKDAPEMLDYLCDECREHFAGVRAMLDAIGIEYEIDPRIVRGLDYYTRTVFEFVHTAAGAQGTVCGGGRYDGLIETLGGPATPAVGFGMGLERLLAVLDFEGVEIPAPEGPSVFLAYIGKKGETLAQKLTAELQAMGINALYDINGRSLKAQMKYADKLGTRWLAVIGDDEADAGGGTLKNMREKTEMPIELTAERLAAAVR